MTCSQTDTPLASCDHSCQRIANSVGIDLRSGGKYAPRLAIKKRESIDPKVFAQYTNLHINKSTLLRLTLAVVFEGKDGTDRYHSRLEQNLISAMKRLCLPLPPKLFPEGLQHQAKAVGTPHLPKANKSNYVHLQNRLLSLNDNDFHAAVRELRKSVDPNRYLNAYLTNQGSLYFKDEKTDCDVFMCLIRTLDLLGLADCILIKEGRDTDISKCTHLPKVISAVSIELWKKEKSGDRSKRTNDLSTTNPYDHGTQHPYIVVLPRGRMIEDELIQTKNVTQKQQTIFLDKSTFLLAIHFMNLCMIDDALSCSATPSFFITDS